MKLSIPDVPPSLNKVLRMHWARKRRLLRAWESQIYWSIPILERKKEQHSLVRKRVKLTLNHSRFYDKDNAYGASKVVLDALKNMQLIVDDAPEWLEVTVEQAKCPHKERRTTIEMEAA